MPWRASLENCSDAGAPMEARHSDELMCHECVELRLGVPGMCHGEAGFGVGKRYKWLIDKPLEHSAAG